MPIFMTFRQFQAAHGVEDTFLESIQLGSPSGSWSKRAERSAKSRLGDKQQRWWDARAAYMILLEMGLIYDPSGDFLNGPKLLAEQLGLKAQALERHAALLESMLKLHPRSYPKLIAAERAEAFALRARIPALLLLG